MKDFQKIARTMTMMKITMIMMILKIRSKAMVMMIVINNKMIIFITINNKSNNFQNIIKDEILNYNSIFF